MLTRPETITLHVFLSIMIFGAVNWGTEAITGRDMLAHIINATGHAGGSTLQTCAAVTLKEDGASAVIPRIVYALVCASALIVGALLLKSSATGGDAAVPHLR